MTAVREGDTHALGTLFDRHHAALYRYFYRMSGSASASEDLTQDVFLRLLKKGETWNPAMKFTSWMYRIAHNTFIDRSRKLKWETEMPAQHEFAAPSGHSLERDEEHALLHKALLRLAPDKRELLILSRFQGFRYEQIGELLGIETNTVKVRVFRALGQLREAYAALSRDPILLAMEAKR